MRGCLQQAAAERIRHHYVSGAHGLQQARHAKQRIAAQFQRIAEAVVHAAQNQIHGLQPGQRLQEDPIVAGDQIRAFHQRESPMASQERMLEIRFVVRPGRQQNNARAPAPVRPGSAGAIFNSASRCTSKKRFSCRTWHTLNTEGSVRALTSRFSSA